MYCIYRISANSFRGNYSFLKLFGQRSQYISIKFPLHKPSENRGNYSREETIQGRKLFAEIRYLQMKHFSSTLPSLLEIFGFHIHMYLILKSKLPSINQNIKTRKNILYYFPIR